MRDIDLEQLLKKAIDHEIELACEEELTKAKERIDQRKSEIISGVALRVSQMVEMQSLDRSLIIKIIKQ
jgi:hypothetical protein